MWWLQTSGYHLAGLIWLIVIAAIFVIALIALSTAWKAAVGTRRMRRMSPEHEGQHPATHSATTAAILVPAELPAVAVVEDESGASDNGLSDSMTILHERYARGELTREQYLQAREDMTMARS